MGDHVHICISIPPQHSVSYVIGYIKGKSAISIARRFVGKTKNFTGENFWARGYFVTTIGLDEEMGRDGQGTLQFRCCSGAATEI